MLQNFCEGYKLYLKQDDINKALEDIQFGVPKENRDWSPFGVIEFASEVREGLTMANFSPIIPCNQPLACWTYFAITRMAILVLE